MSTFLFNDIFQKEFIFKNPIHYRANVQKKTLFISVKISLVLWTIIATTQWVVYEEEVYRSDNLCYFILPMDYMLVGCSWGDSG